MRSENRHLPASPKPSKWARLKPGSGSFFLKITLTVTLIVVLSVAAVTYVSIYRQSAALKAGMISSNRLLADQLSLSVRNAFFSLNWVYVEDMFKKSIADCPDIQWIQIIRPEGDTYLSVGEPRPLKEIPVEGRPVSQAPKETPTGEMTWESEQTYGIVQPIPIGKDTWLLSMGVSLASIEQMKREIMINNLAWGGLILLVGCLISFLLSRKISRPIAKLVKATEEIAKGEFDHPIPVSANDEIAVLVNGFNEMTRKLAQFKEELSASEERFRTISASAQDAIMMLDQKGRITFWNRAAEKTFGYASKEVMGERAETVMVPERYRESYREGFAGFAGTGDLPRGGMTSEYTALRKDGTEFPSELSLSTVKLKGIWHAVAIFRDIGKRKATEAALQTAKEHAEAANRAKSEFLANMSHEIRTPLNGVIGMLNLLEEAGLEHEEADYVKLAVISAESLLSIINDILDFSKIEAGRMRFENRSFDLEDEVFRLMKLFARKAENRDVELITHFDVGVPRFVIGDPIRIRQVLFNLVGNALKFTPEGHVRLEVRALESNAESATMEIAVSDTGIGIPEDKMAHIFEHFTQADASTTRKHGGTGLGLAISRQLVHLMGGELTATSMPGEKTTFQFALNLSIDTNAREDLNGFLPPPVNRLLMVDDNDINPRVFSEYLAGWRIPHDMCADPLKALELVSDSVAKNDPYDVIMIDYLMPEMDGPDLCRALRANPALKDLKIIILTSLEGSDDRKRFQSVGVSSYLVKPVSRHALAEALIHAAGYGDLSEPYTDRSDPGQPHPRSRLQELPGASNTRVLLVEDNAINQKAAVAILEKIGFTQITVADHGLIALDLLTYARFDLIFMDVQMPHMDGHETTRQIRKMKVKTSRTPIIAMTANAIEGDMERCLEAGMNDYISKPIDKNILVEKLKRWLTTAAGKPGEPKDNKEDGPKAAPPAEYLPVFDFDEAAARYDHDIHLLREIVEAFVEETPAAMDDIALAIDSAAGAAAGSKAHALKGGASYIGVKRFQAVALSLEKSGKAGDLSAAAGLLPEMRREFEQFKNLISGFKWDDEGTPVVKGASA